MLNRVQKWLKSGGRPFARGDLIKVATSNGHVAPTHPEWPEYRPAHPIEHDFRADNAIDQGHADAFTLVIRRIPIFAKAVSKEAAEQCLAASVANGVRGDSDDSASPAIGRPDDVQTWTEADIPEFLPAGFVPNRQTFYPEAGPGCPTLG